ncbi:unnamed protein product [Rotaria magnacalcarata]|uniref:Elongator complex protein 1 n=1 Tax=Rotaria magnacalcarata TaxID=392030 RepID=A0A819JX00_9BILA|nr:unnamed protein product [Rotaria magnacalcarata]CAF3936452.1 unnamed protein product [Rotaria magnacalcarata]
MQNLSLYNTRAIGLHDLTGANVARRFAIDTDKQIIYLLNSHSIYSLTLEDEKLKSIYTTTDKTITLEDLSYISELNHLCFGLSNGDLVSIQFDNDFDENVNVIGTLEECIHELKSSPDLQILVAVTNSKVLLLSTNNDYEPIAEAILDTSEFGEQQLVNVGWGSKTTQFHGSVGKKAALETAQTTPTTLRANDDDNRSRIVWRDDGDLFAISFISLTNQWRTIKIFNKQGQLQATNESPLNGFIESAIAWKISGEFIGAAMRFNNGQKLTISFLEKNGLKHGELVLETGENIKQYVEHIAWNKDSTILALVLHKENDSYLQLWSSSNYHWYLKQNIPFPSVNIQSLLWDIDIANKLHFITNDGQYHSVTWSWISQVSYTNTRSLVFLIDGCHLFVSDFTHSSIPPPMSSYEIVCPLPILAVAFDDDHDQLILILSDRSLAVCGTSSGLSDYRTIIRLSEIKSAHYVSSIISSAESPITSIHHATHYRLINQEFYFIENSHLHIYNLQTKTIKTSLSLNFNCLTTAVDHEEVKHLYLEDEHGKIFRLDNNELHAKMHFPRPCPHFSAVLNGRFVGLTENYRLYLNTAELAHNCNSYFIHDKTILVYSTLQHQLAFRSLVNDEIVAGISQRRTERGTRIVCTAFTDLKLVLQMPRGNLETIYPRPLLLTYISADLIDSETTNYKRAFELMRKNRLNLNFLYDYNPKQFFDNIPSFISKTRSDDDICLFISEIENEKNTREEYMKYILKQEKHPSIDAKIWHPKANLLCEKFRSCLLSTENCTEHMNSILTTFVKQSPPNMEGALVFLSQHPKYFDNAIRYLTYFIDIDRLYDTALGTYNFDLVLMISEKTQKDPKEYLPELNQLRLINNYHWQKFKIDCRLKRFKKAIENACDYFVEQLLNRPDEHENERFQEFINILENNRFYKLAIRKFLSNQQIKPTMEYINHVIKLYADYLMTKKYYIEAALIYERGRFLDHASKAFRQGKDVQNSLKLLPSVSIQAKQSNTGMDQYRSLAEQFRNDTLYIESGQIYENHLDDCEEALLSYLQGHEWSHAIRLFATSLSRRHDLYEHEFLSAFNGVYDDLERQIHNDYTKFQSHTKRLSLLRTNLFQHIKEILDSGRDYDIDENDDQSDNEDPQFADDRRTLVTRSNRNADDSGSIKTRLTKKSGSVSSSKKSQRRAAQQLEKLIQLKEGSKHEDLAIVRELWLLVTKIDKQNYDVRHVNKICYQISTHQNSLEYEQKGELLQNKYNEYLNAIEKQLTTIWLTNPEQQQQENVQVMVINKKIREKFKKELDLVSNQYRVSPVLVSKTSQWKLVLFDSDISV